MTDNTIDSPIIKVNDLKFYYPGDARALHGIDLEVQEKQVTALIGPSGCGKSTMLRCFNRMNDLIDGCRVEGEVLIEGDSIYAPSTDVIELRRQVGMVFSKI